MNFHTFFTRIKELSVFRKDDVTAVLTNLTRRCTLRYVSTLHQSVSGVESNLLLYCLAQILKSFETGIRFS